MITALRYKPPGPKFNYFQMTQLDAKWVYVSWCPNVRCLSGNLVTLFHTLGISIPGLICLFALSCNSTFVCIAFRRVFRFAVKIFAKKMRKFFPHCVWLKLSIPVGTNLVRPTHSLGAPSQPGTGLSLAQSCSYGSSRDIYPRFASLVRVEGPDQNRNETPQICHFK